ncbi:MAG: putative rane protein [Thermomicrobiales bacterium]|nr:putative rane protein [Thermomicrobiales bacterium]
MMHLTLPILHGTGGYPTGPLHSEWHPDPTVVLGVIVLIAAYLLWTGSLNRRRSDVADRPVSTGRRVAFVCGSVAFLLALAPPLDDWADHYLLSAHMFQHLIIMFVVAPLWLFGTPAWLLAPILQKRLIAPVGYLLTRPVPSFLLANLIVTIWHLPEPYNAALRNEPLHIAQHLSFLGAALLAWWPVLGPWPAWPRLARPLQCLYLFVQTIPGGIIGAFVTLAAPGIYGFYDNVPRIWGIDLATDQELAGLMMWVGSGTIYLLWITVIFFQWSSREEAKELQAVTNQPSASGGLAAPLRTTPKSAEGA